jgi:uncharacterized membrane protein
VRGIIDNPWASFGVGLAAAAVILLAWLATAGSDWVLLLSFLLRFAHVLAAMVWVGLVFFVNFVQLIALQGADDQQRGFLGKAVIPQVALWFRHASTVTVASGALLLVAAGYAMPAYVYGSDVFVPPGRAALLWGGVLGGLVMWMLVHMYIWPSLQVALGLRPGDAAAKTAARARVALFARLNLIIALPVTFAMLAAAHLA